MAVWLKAVLPPAAPWMSFRVVVEAGAVAGVHVGDERPAAAVGRHVARDRQGFSGRVDEELTVLGGRAARLDAGAGDAQRRGGQRRRARRVGRRRGSGGRRQELSSHVCVGSGSEQQLAVLDQVPGFNRVEAKLDVRHLIAEGSQRVLRGARVRVTEEQALGSVEASARVARGGDVAATGEDPTAGILQEGWEGVRIG